MLDKLFPTAHSVFRRFPLAIIMVAGFCATILYDSNIKNLDNELQFRLSGGFVFGAYLAVILTLWGEGRGKIVSALLKLPIVLGGFALGLFFRELNFLTMAAIGASILLLGNAPYFRKPRNDVEVWDFTHKLWTAVLFTTAGSMIYVIGIYSISEALKVLLGINIRELVEDILLPIGLAFLAPLAWLSMLPDMQEGAEEDTTDSLRNPGFISRAVGFIGTWILAPLTMIYAAILVLYGVKIIVQGDLPNGEIGRLVTPFLIIGTLTWLILDPPFIQEKKLAKWYSRLWFPLSIPAAVLLGIAAFIRINEYGWTVERYLLVLAAVWALGIGIWYLIKRQKGFDIRIIPGFAAILLAVSAIGPWGASGLSIINQNHRLVAGLKANDLLENGKIKSSLEITDHEAGRMAKSALDYLLKHKKYKLVQKLLPAEQKWSEFLCKNKEGEIDEDCVDRSNIIKAFGLDKVKLINPKRNGIYYSYSADNKPIKISGYDYISRPIHLWSLRIKSKNNKKRIIGTFGEYKIYHNGPELILTKSADEIKRLDIMQWVMKWPVNDNNKIELNPYIVLIDEPETAITMVVRRASYNKKDKTELENLSFYILTKGVRPNAVENMGELPPIPEQP